MSIKINYHKNFVPKDSYCNDASELGDWDIKELPNTVDEIWYHYFQAPYEGSGSMILRVGEKYHLWDLGHCSCYGPTDRVDISGAGFDSLDSLLASCSEHYQSNGVAALVEFAKFGCLITE